MATKTTILTITILISINFNFHGETSSTKRKEIGFPGMNNETVIKLTEKYATTHRKWLFDLLETAEEYRIFVRQEIEKRKMPEILEYLPVVESNYTINAKSKSGAQGLWQFMTNSVSPFLICNEYIDERLDPWKSTEAALTKLKDNYNMFGDWLLAITAYNCGAGALKKAIKEANSNDFWYLREKGFLSEQASQYIPKLLAIADVIENAEYYDIEMPSISREMQNSLNKYYEYDYITVKQTYYIETLSNLLCIDADELKRLNSALVNECTPPDEEYTLRLPKGTKRTAEYILKLNS